MMKKIVTIVMFMLFIPMTVSALAVKAQVDKTRMTDEDSLNLTVVVNDGNAEIDTSVIRDFRIVSHSTGSSFQWINGRSSSEYTHQYILTPLKKGLLTIPPLPVRHKGKSIFTENIDIVVDNQKVTRGLNAGSDIFVKATVNDDSPYPGQPIIYTFSLYYGVQVSGPSLKLPDFKNFSVKENDKDKQFSTLINGREYQVIERNVILDPLKPGTFTIPPSVLNCQMVVERRQRSRDPFDSFFNDPFFNRGALTKKTLRTNPVVVRVMPLPKNPYPVPFSGLVGRFGLKAELESAVVNVGDSTNLSLILEGQGNLMDATEPPVNVPSGFKMYKDTPEEDISLNAEGYSGKKTFRLALVGVKEGSYTIPPVSMVYFDAEKGVYRVLSTQPVNITVNPSAGGAAERKPTDDGGTTEAAKAPPGLIKKKVEYTGHDILPLKESLSGAQNRFSFSFTGFVLGILLPLVILCGLKTAVHYSGKGKTVSALMAERAENSLKKARQKGLDDGEFLALIYQAFVSSVFSKNGSTGETLTKREVRAILASKGCEGSMIEDAENLLDRIESGRFAGQTLDDALRHSLLEDTKTMIRRIG